MIMRNYAAPPVARLDAPTSNNFNLMRLVLASLVLLSHSYELIDGDRSREPLTRIFHTLTFGEVAVDGFFLLSGYLIVGSYIKRPNVISYLKNRILRIYPGFLVCVLICVLVVGGVGGGQGYYSKLNGSELLLNLPFLNLEGVPPVFDGAPGPVLNGSLWSLNPEFECYLLALICGLLGFFKRPILWLALGCVFAIFHGLYVTGVTIQLFGHPHNFYRVLYRLGIFFIVGGYLQILGDAVKYRLSITVVCLGLLGLGLMNRVLAEPALAILGGYILMYLGSIESATLAKLRRLPDVSYGTYLYGWPIQKLLIFYIGAIHPLLLFALSLPLAWAMGTASWFCVEKPALSLKSKSAKLPLKSKLGEEKELPVSGKL
jgi:peptidoglycan/LPS O-acetylase OafA/YrhL